MSAPNPEKLHGYAVAAEKNMEALATGLAAAGAPEPAVKAVSQMAEAIRGIIKTLAGAAQADAPPEPKPTVGSATDEMQSELNAKREGGQQ